MRIPISIIAIYQLTAYQRGGGSLHNDGIGGLEIQTQTTSSCGKNKDLIWRVWVVESRQQSLSIVGFSGTIKTTELPASMTKEIGNEGHDFRHLEEDQYLSISSRVSIEMRRTYLVTGLKELRQDSIEQLELS
jgi:hypothetical protein